MHKVYFWGSGKVCSFVVNKTSYQGLNIHLWIIKLISLAENLALEKGKRLNPHSSVNAASFKSSF